MAWEPGKPTDSENEYFKRQDAEWIKNRRAELDAARAASAAAPKLNCPRCNTPTLAERSFHHVTIDVCSSCSGVWLDGGELEMLAQMPGGQIQSLAADLE